MDCNDGGDIRGDRQQGQHQRLVQAGRKQPSLEGQNPGQNPGGDQSSGLIFESETASGCLRRTQKRQA